jgi:hypothetical protein
MIKIRNLDHVLLELKVPGAVTTGTEADAALVPFDGFITNIFAKAVTGGTGSTPSVVDVNKNGTTIFATATKITIAATTGAASYSAQNVDPTPVAAGDLLSLDVDSIAGSPAGFVVALLLSRQNPGGGANLADLTLVL